MGWINPQLASTSEFSLYVNDFLADRSRTVFTFLPVILTLYCSKVWYTSVLNL